MKETTIQKHITLLNFTLKTINLYLKFIKSN
jgi:hypothetical protein